MASVKPLLGQRKQYYLAIKYEREIELFGSKISLFVLLLVIFFICQHQRVAVRMSSAFYLQPTKQVRPLFKSTFQIQDIS